MKIQLTAVNYLNTFPFKYGIEHSNAVLKWADIQYASPYECAKMLMNHTTHIALAPVAVLAYQPQLHIVTDFCLSTNDMVKSVKLYSKKSIDEIQSVILDYQSLSSVSLLKVLMRYYWKKEVAYINGYKNFEESLNADAMVVIGDRTFDLNGKFPYEYDLATEWYRFCRKPFVFAAWISNIQLPEEHIQDLNNAFEYGLSHIEEVVEQALVSTNILSHLNKDERKKQIYNYLTNNMQYRFNEERKQSLQYFLKLFDDVVKETTLNFIQ